MREIDIGNPKYMTFTKLVQVRNFITFELKIIRYEERERETHNLSMLTALNPSQLSTQPTRGTRKHKFSGLAQVWISTSSFRGRN